MHYYFVTGSSKGIGLAIVKALLEKESNFIIGLSRSNTFKHDRFEHKVVDFSDIASLVRQVEEVFQVKEGAKSITLINNAGTLGEVGYIGELDNDVLPEVYNVNLIAPAILINTFIKKFKSSKAELLVMNISSGAGGYPVDGWSGYCATKAALNMLSEVIYKEQEIRGSKIKVFSVAPGVVDTGMQEKIRNTSSQKFSGVNKFIDLKNDKILTTAENAAGKILKILDNPDNYKEITQDVRAI